MLFHTLSSEQCPPHPPPLCCSDGLVVSKALKERAAEVIAGVQDLDLTAPREQEEEEEEEGAEEEGGGAGPSSSGLRHKGAASGGAASVKAEADRKLPQQGAGGVPPARKSLFDELDEAGAQEDPEKEVLAFEVYPDQVCGGEAHSAQEGDGCI